MVKRLLAVAFACGVGLMLGSCSSFSDVVADSWPHFAGGEPKGLPPRPGEPGYNKFIAHGQPQAAAGAAPAAATGSAGTATAPSAFTEQQNPQPGFQAPPAADGPRSNGSAVSGGLY